MPTHLETSIEIAREAGALLMDYFGRVSFELKGEADLVTEADRASERLVVERLRAHFPDHSIEAEEGGGNESASEYRWFVDPVDGTTNFAHGFPVFNVTLALERKGELVAGVIFDPTRNEMFAAEKGGGSYLNGKRIHVSPVKRMEDSLVATGFPSFKRHQNVNIFFYWELGMRTHGVRRAGSAAIDLAYVSCGRLEAFWEFGLKPWDMAAGILLIEEAGGKTSGMRGEKTDLRGPYVFGSNGAVHGQMIEAFGDVFAGKFHHPLPPLLPS
jgi:myo-inositol-1(or 4)-monophosphatase